jgi:hypothetical protein
MVAGIAREGRNQTIIQDVLSGIPIPEVARKHGMSRSHLYAVLSDDDYRQILHAEQRRQIALIPKATQVVEDLLDSEDDKIKLAAAKTVHANTGITPAHTQSILIERLLIQQGNSSEDAAFRSLAMDFLGLANPDPKPDVIDVTPCNKDE